MDKPNGLEMKSLQTQLENYKLIAEVNTELLDENEFPGVEFLGKLELAQGYLNEAQQWEEAGDQTHSHSALSNANMMIEEAGALIKHLLYQDSFWDDGNLQQGPILA
jgi:hypothetical protein